MAPTPAGPAPGWVGGHAPGVLAATCAAAPAPWGGGAAATARPCRGNWRRHRSRGGDGGPREGLGRWDLLSLWGRRAAGGSRCGSILPRGGGRLQRRGTASQQRRALGGTVLRGRAPRGAPSPGAACDGWARRLRHVTLPPRLGERASVRPGAGLSHTRSWPQSGRNGLLSDEELADSLLVCCYLSVILAESAEYPRSCGRGRYGQAASVCGK